MRNGNLSDQRADQNHIFDNAQIPKPKMLGVYLIEAGLISPAQLQVALNDQKTTSMRVGEILVARGWVKEQTVEYLMQKIVLPERHTAQLASDIQEKDARPTSQPATSKKEDSWVEAASPRKNSKKPRLTWGELPVSQPLPAGEESDDDVKWDG